MEFHLEVKDKMLVCPECGSQQVWRRGKRTRHIKSVPIGSKPVVFVTEVPRCECRSARAGAAHLQNGILKAMASGASALRSLGPSLLKHAKHILSYFQVPITSAMMEGINNKIGRPQRTAYG